MSNTEKPTIYKVNHTYGYARGEPSEWSVSYLAPTGDYDIRMLSLKGELVLVERSAYDAVAAQLAESKADTERLQKLADSQIAYATRLECELKAGRTLDALLGDNGEIIELEGKVERLKRALAYAKDRIFHAFGPDSVVPVLDLIEKLERGGE